MTTKIPCVMVAVLLAALPAGATVIPVFQAQQTGPGAVFSYQGQWNVPGGDGLLRAAEVVFSRDVSGHLIVTLTNTFAGDVWYHNELLAAVFFDTTAPLTLTPTSALVAPGSAVLFPETANPSAPHAPLPADEVGGEFAFRSGLVGAPGDTLYGISSVGVDLFGPHDLFPPGIDLDSPASPDGLNYGITSAGDDPSTGANPGVMGSDPIIRNSVTFTLSGLPDDFEPSTGIRNVWILYGTAIPEPATLATLGAGMALLGVRRRLGRA